MHHCFDMYFARHQGGRGMGRFGRGFGDGDNMGGRAFGMGRKLASVDLQLLILALLSEKPYHGYEVIKELEERSKGFYVPSPGMVYPALTYLEEIGHATVVADGARKLYHITAAGSEHLTKNQLAAAALLEQFARVGERMTRVRRAMRAEESDPDRDSDARHGSPELLSARRKLKMALASAWNASHAEQQRVAEVLLRAAAEIEGTQTKS